MDREKLKLALGSFESTCVDKGYIDTNTPEAFAFDEIYQGIFIVTVFVKHELINAQHDVSVLNTLIEILYQCTDSKTRESILTLRLAEDADYSDFQRKAAA